ncbi:tetraspanin-9 isoform 2-T2 [Clarias gariepinus]|uniref:tetraspanin-9 isoform X1 n=1 Tax=Clarias gariepinus TaxID=13013 RepID=UPI00234D55C1|nr:tetraspanin-9 isoform X1 [Clarias gariepinus]XP_053370656.1 tetraspanin-9 isoform X2 [Clarias gariepinus]
MGVSRGCLCCVKYLMFIFNLIFWLGGCGLFGVGVWLSIRQSEISYLPLSFPSLSAANLLLVAGGVTMVTGFLGCLGSLKEQRCLLMTFFVILLLLFLTEAALILMLGLFHKEIDEKAKEDLINEMMKYDNNTELKKSWDNMQRIFKCCGVNNHTDWNRWTNQRPHPESCCRKDTNPCYRWEEPCYKKAKALVLDNITWVLGFGVCLVIVQILALAFSMLMYCQILRVEKYTD